MTNVKLLSSKDCKGETRLILNKLEKNNKDIIILKALANSNNCFRNFCRMVNSLMTYSKLPGDIRELIIMRLAYVNQANYIWNEHFEYAKLNGITELKLSNLRKHKINKNNFTKEEILVIKYTDSIIKHNKDSNLTKKIKSIFNDEEFVELNMTIGWWGGMTSIVAYGLDLD